MNHVISELIMPYLHSRITMVPGLFRIGIPHVLPPNDSRNNPNLKVYVSPLACRMLMVATSDSLCSNLDALMLSQSMVIVLILVDCSALEI